VSAPSPLTSPKIERPSRATARIWLYRLAAAIGAPLALLLALELGLRVGGFGQSYRYLIPDEKPGCFRTNPDFVSWFLPSDFDLRPLNFRISARRPEHALRVVVLGESAAQGIPVPAFGFVAQLRAQLRARYPGREVEVINTGIVAINSHVIYQIARELSRFSPDLYVVYMGNNEVVGPYGPGCAYLSEMPPLWAIRLSVFVRSTRIGQLAARLLGHLGRGKKPAEWGGMSMFVDHSVAGDDPRLETVYRNFESNLRDIVQVASSSGARTVLCTVVSNLKDSAPFLSLHRPGLAEAELTDWTKVFNRGRIEWLLDDPASAGPDLLQALRIDPHYADTLFMLGSVELERGDSVAARQDYIGAQHWDALRFRPDARINEIVRQVARENPGTVTLVDSALALGSDARSTVVPAGRELFFEHVHFTWEGSYRLARLLAEASEKALFGEMKGGFPWLDSDGCAAALAYTPHERLTVLQKLTTIVEHPPFTNQLTYCEDEARLARDLARAKVERANPGLLLRAQRGVEEAAAADPGNADLAKIAEDIDDDRGNLEGALAEARRSEALQPWSFALPADVAIKLSRLGRYDEAQRLLRQTAAACTPRDRAAMAPAFADLFSRTRRFDEGARYLDGESARRPADLSLRLIRGRLARLSGDSAAAERVFRGLRAADPSNPQALEELVSLLSAAGQAGAAEKETLAAVDSQPRNQANNLRAAIFYDSHGDDAQSVRFLLAAERSGPVTSGVELTLARKLFNLKRPDDALSHLAEARRISLYEGDPGVTKSIEQGIEHIFSQMH
jgi:tetratricopeptide (TPR) repeat protein